MFSEYASIMWRQRFVHLVPGVLPSPVHTKKVPTSMNVLLIVQNSEQRCSAARHLVHKLRWIFIHCQKDIQAYLWYMLSWHALRLRFIVAVGSIDLLLLTYCKRTHAARKKNPAHRTVRRKPGLSTAKLHS